VTSFRSRSHSFPRRRVSSAVHNACARRRHELVVVEEPVVQRPRLGLLREAPEEQRSGQEQPDQEEGKRAGNGQEEAKARDDLREASEANQPHTVDGPRLNVVVVVSVSR